MHIGLLCISTLMCIVYVITSVMLYDLKLIFFLKYDCMAFNSNRITWLKFPIAKCNGRTLWGRLTRLMSRQEFGVKLVQTHNSGESKALFTRSVKNFPRREFFVSLINAGNFLLYTENILLLKFCLRKQTYAERTKFFTLRVNKA